MTPGMLKAERICRSVLLVFLLILPSSLCTRAFGQEGEAKQTRQWTYEWERERLPQMGLPIRGRPEHVVTLHLNDKKHWYPSSPRLAVLYYDPVAEVRRFVIYKPWDGKLPSIFSIQQGKGDLYDWEETTKFPSYSLPGFVLWGGQEYAREKATVICYVDQTFQVVFQGLDVTFLDLDGDGIPEIVSHHVYKPASNVENGRQVHTWNGSEFVLATRLKDWDKRFSDEVITAVKRAKKKSKEPPKE